MNAQESFPWHPGGSMMVMSGDSSGPVPAAAPISILLIDDDVELCDLMQKFFSRHGISVEVVHNSQRGLARALAGDTTWSCSMS